ncbi:MAG TPA: alcohol dehydrogenase catalytic domain-containing protein [Candidatus Dormibacteraeota bacterium]|nr:alcohol dehydrogenase catalytic domain-containing protein [Candidatus Dormibacteraeota bacterium]
MLVAERSIELREVAEPTPPPGGALVRVRAALTDGTDLKAYRRGHPQMPFPSPFGHEFSGEILKVGEGVSDWRVGEAIACVHSAPCGACFWCVGGEEELCEIVMERKILGAYADAIVIPRHILERNAFKKPDAVSFAEAAFLEPLSCVVHSRDFLALRRRSTVAILGDGGFGLLHAMLLARDGHDVVVIGRRPERLALAARLGIERIDASKADLTAALRERSAGRGVDALIECTGSSENWELAPALVRRGGAASFFGGLPADAMVSFRAARLHYDEVRLISPFHFTPRAVASAFALLRDRSIDCTPLISHRYRLVEIADAFEQLDAGVGLKALIEP